MELKTTNIKGKEYVQVNERLKAFRSMSEFAGWSLVTEIVELKEDSCTMKAIISDADGKVKATGYAREVIAKSPVNKFAFVENCETSAWGRALGNLGIGIDSAVCSAEELELKLAQDDFKKEVKTEKAKETRETNKKVEEYNKTENGLKSRYDGCYAYIKKLASLEPFKDGVIIKKAMQLADELGQNNMISEKESLEKLLNEKLPAEETDTIPY